MRNIPSSLLARHERTLAVAWVLSAIVAGVLGAVILCTDRGHWLLERAAHAHLERRAGRLNTQYGQARAHIEQQRYGVAETALTMLLQDLPQQRHTRSANDSLRYHALRSLSDIYVATQRPRRLQQNQETIRAARLGGTHAEVLYSIALFDLGRNDEAETIALEILSTRPIEHELLNRLLHYYREKGRHEEVLHQYARYTNAWCAIASCRVDLRSEGEVVYRAHIQPPVGGPEFTWLVPIRTTDHGDRIVDEIELTLYPGHVATSVAPGEVRLVLSNGTILSAAVAPGSPPLTAPPLASTDSEPAEYHFHSTHEPIHLLAALSASSRPSMTSVDHLAVDLSIALPYGDETKNVADIAQAALSRLQAAGETTP